MPGALEALESEHEEIEVFLDALDGMAARLQANEHVPREDLLDALTVMVEFADKGHHAKEEDVLFPALARASPQVGAKITRRLTSDHRTFRKLVWGIRDLVPRVSSAKAIRTALVRNLRLYTKMLREHIRIEDEQLLPEAERTMSAEQREDLAEAFGRVGHADVGWGLHAAYEAMIRRLAETYPPVPPAVPAARKPARRDSRAVT